jgi:hypothetical protein
MRRPLAAVAVAVVILGTAAAGGLLIAACGGSSDSASTTQTATGQSPGGQQDMSSMFADALDPLVEDGTITSDQESAVIEALGSSGPSGQGQGGQPSAGATPPSGQTPSAGGSPPASAQQGSMRDPSEMFDSALDDLVSDGTITASQQSAISEALSSAMQQASPGQQGATSSTQQS